MASAISASRSHGSAAVASILLAASLAWTTQVVHADNTAPQTSEELKSKGVYQIKANALYSLTPPVTGAGVTAAIIDTGIMAGHTEFLDPLALPITSRLLMMDAYNGLDGSTNVTDGNGHGTHVSGIVGAARDGLGMFGVAYNAYLLPIKVLNDRGSGTAQSVANGILHAVERRNYYMTGGGSATQQYAPFVINLSLGSSAPSTQITGALQAAVGAGMVVAAAAGNDGAANPGYPARQARETWANGQIIAVGAVDANNVIASFSNRAGDTMNYYLVAPGVSIYSTYPKLNRKTKQYDAGYASLSGTSMATPYVTGAVALLKSGWSYLEAPTIVQILLTSATDLGAPGVDAIYGHGLLNLENALAPSGEPTVKTTGGSAMLGSTSLSGSGLLSAALRNAGRNGQLQAMSFDRYGRNYEVDLAPVASRQTSSGDGLAALLATFDASQAQATRRGDLSLRVNHRSDPTRLAMGSRSTVGEAGFALSATDSAERELVFGMAGMAGHAFGLAGELTRDGQALAGAAHANPYFALLDQPTHSGVGWVFKDDLRVKLGVLGAAPQVATRSGTRTSFGQSMLLTELSGRSGGLLWTAGLGQLSERDALLGVVQGGALALAGRARTQVFQLGLATNLSPSTHLALHYAGGRTGPMRNQANSIVTGYSSLRSEAFAATLTMDQALQRGDQLRFTLAQPLRVRSGTMNMTTSVGVASDGTPVMGSRSVSLQPLGREVRADLFYLTPTKGATRGFLGLSLRHQPEHDRAAASEVTIGAGLQISF